MKKEPLFNNADVMGITQRVLLDQHRSEDTFNLQKNDTRIASNSYIVEYNHINYCASVPQKRCNGVLCLNGSFETESIPRTRSGASP